MIRTLSTVLVLAVFILLAAVFTWLNPGMVQLDLAFAPVELSKSLAFLIAFVAGWGFGLLSCSAVLLRLVHQRRKLRRSVRLAEAEVKNLRGLPMQDAG